MNIKELVRPDLEAKYWKGLAKITIAKFLGEDYAEAQVEEMQETFNKLYDECFQDRGLG